MLRPSLDRLISSEVGSCDKLRRGFEKLQLRLSPMRALLALSLLAVATCLNVASTTIRKSQLDVAFAAWRQGCVVGTIYATLGEEGALFGINQSETLSAFPGFQGRRDRFTAVVTGIVDIAVAGQYSFFTETADDDDAGAKTMTPGSSPPARPPPPDHHHRHRARRQPRPGAFGRLDELRVATRPGRPADVGVRRPGASEGHC